jgi:hypothetical protein
MARPMAASSNTDPSDRPYQTFCAFAHSARRDGEPDGREQQHRAKRKPVVQVLHDAENAQLALDGGHGDLSRLLHFGYGRIGGSATQQCHGILVTALFERCNSFYDLRRRCAALDDQQRRARLRKGCQDTWILFKANSGIESRQGFFVTGFKQRVCGRDPRRRISRTQCHGAKSAVDHTTQAVVNAHTLRIGRERCHGLTGGGVERPVPRILVENRFSSREKTTVL